MKGRELVDFIKAFPEIHKHCAGLATIDDIHELQEEEFVFVNTEYVPSFGLQTIFSKKNLFSNGIDLG